MKTVSGSLKVFREAINSVISIRNKFLLDSHCTLFGFGLCIDLRKTGQTNHLHGSLTEAGLAGMLEDYEYVTVDIVFFFTWEVADECCGLIESANITRMFTKYVDIVNHVYRHYLNPGWSEKEPEILLQKIILTKVLSCHVFESYRPSKTWIQKWNALDHLCEAISDMSEIFSCETFWEFS